MCNLVGALTFKLEERVGLKKFGFNSYAHPFDTHLIQGSWDRLGVERGIWVEPDGLARIGPIFWRVEP